MYDCEDLVETLHGQACDQVNLALLALTAPVAGMHIELALFSEGQARIVEELCEQS